MNNKVIFEKMVAAGFNDIVGGGDPVDIGQSNIDVMDNMLEIVPGMKVLDFGCGCGRVALPILERIGDAGRLVGVDIIPELIQFCQDEIKALHPNSDFYQLNAKNSHYKKWTKDQLAGINQIDELSEIPESGFDLIFAFSVFTHLGIADSKKYLEQLSKLLGRNGKLVISALFINESSRRGVRNNTASVPFSPRKIEKRRDVYFCTVRDKLGGVGYREESFIEMAAGAGLEPSRIYYGEWPGRVGRLCGHDVIVLERGIPDLPKDFDAKAYVANYKDLDWDAATEEGRARAERHYVRNGYFEGRRWD